MLIMPANNSKGLVHYWAGIYGHLGHLYSPGGFRGPYPWLPYAIDNGAYPAWEKKQPWNEAAFVELCDRIKWLQQKPRWIVVPDVVTDKVATLERWNEWEPKLRSYGIPLAFAVQDGMDLTDVPKSADVVFVGGTTSWKRQNIARFCQVFPRVHVGRINTWKWVWYCHDCGAESVDGTGFFRGDPAQSQGLEDYLKTVAGKAPRSYQLPINFEDEVA